MPIINFAPEFDLEYYGKIYPELNFLPEPVSKLHYERFAVEQGRSTCIYDRREYLRAFLQEEIDQRNLKALEIGAWNNPLIKGKNVKYFEAMDMEKIERISKDYGRDASTTPHIDFVSPTGDLGVIDETFDIVASVHVIEHCPNLIEHLQNVSRILNAGGLYVLIVPDKRYCFDYYHAESTFSEVVDAFIFERKIPRLADVINLAYTRTHNNPYLHWLGEHGEPYGYRNTPLELDAKAEIMGEYFLDDGKGIDSNELFGLIKKYVEALDKGEYISTHNWRFTPKNFGYIIKLLKTLGFIDLTLYRLCHTIWGRQEFVAILEKA